MKFATFAAFLFGAISIGAQAVEKVVLDATVVCIKNNMFPDEDDRQSAFHNKFNFKREISYTWRVPEGTDTCYILVNSQAGKEEYQAIVNQIDLLVRGGQSGQISSGDVIPPEVGQDAQSVGQYTEGKKTEAQVNVVVPAADINLQMTAPVQKVVSDSTVLPTASPSGDMPISSVAGK